MIQLRKVWSCPYFDSTDILGFCRIWFIQFIFLNIPFKPGFNKKVHSAILLTFNWFKASHNCQNKVSMSRLSREKWLSTVRLLWARGVFASSTFYHHFRFVQKAMFITRSHIQATHNILRRNWSPKCLLITRHQFLCCNTYCYDRGDNIYRVKSLPPEITSYNVYVLTNIAMMRKMIQWDLHPKTVLDKV